MKKLFYLSFFLCMTGHTQNKQILYDFANLPQTLLLNPGAEVGHKFHLGFPGLSQISVHGGFSGFSAYDLFADDGVSINDKIKSVIGNYGKSEFVFANEQIEVINGGFRLQNNDFLSFGYYQEFDFLVKIPKDLINLFYEGNTIIDKKYSFNKLAARTELLGVFHVGLSKRLRSNLQVGARMKIYSGVFNASSKNNKGSFYTTFGTNNIYQQHLDNINFLVQSAGLNLDDDEDITAEEIKKRMLLGGSLGLGIDVGFTYHLKKQLVVTGSIIDLGFMSHSNNIESFTAKGDFEVEGFQLFFDPDNPDNYWGDLEEEFEEEVVYETIHDKYISFRPVKLYGGLSYSFGQSYDDCRFLINPDIYNNKIGFQLFSTLGAVHSYTAATIFYEARLGKHLQSKITYTADPFSFTNIGLGLSARFGAFNMYVVADNLLNLSNLYNAKSASFQWGINFIFKNKN